MHTTVERGETPVPAGVIDVLPLGPVFYHRLLSRRPITEGFVGTFLSTLNP